MLGQRQPSVTVDNRSIFDPKPQSINSIKFFMHPALAKINRGSVTRPFPEFLISQRFSPESFDVRVRGSGVDDPRPRVAGTAHWSICKGRRAPIVPLDGLILKSDVLVLGGSF